jgi:hypothetical protein
MFEGMAVRHIHSIQDNSLLYMMLLFRGQIKWLTRRHSVHESKCIEIIYGHDLWMWHFELATLHSLMRCRWLLPAGSPAPLQPVMQADSASSDWKWDW